MVKHNYFSHPFHCVDLFVISSCSYTFHGYNALITAQGKSASLILFEGDRISPCYISNMIYNQSAEIIVFFEMDEICLLGTLKKLVFILNELPVSRTVSIYSKLPDSWLYFTLKRLVKNNEKLSLIRLASFADAKNSFSYNIDTLPNFSRLINMGPHRDWIFNLKPLTKRELDISLNSFRGVTIQEQCKLTGLSSKTIYAYRKEGLKKIRLLYSWLDSNNSSTTWETIKGNKCERNANGSRSGNTQCPT